MRLSSSFTTTEIEFITAYINNISVIFQNFRVNELRLSSFHLENDKESASAYLKKNDLDKSRLDDILRRRSIYESQDMNSQ